MMQALPGRLQQMRRLQLLAPPLHDPCQTRRRAGSITRSWCVQSWSFTQLQGLGLQPCSCWDAASSHLFALLRPGVDDLDVKHPWEAPSMSLRPS